MIDLTTIYELKSPCVLTALPCGCVTEACLKADGDHFVCPWCEATFLDVDLAEWLNTPCEESTLFMGDGPKPMIRWQDMLHEVFGEQEDMPVIAIGEDLVRVSEFEWVAN